MIDDSFPKPKPTYTPSNEAREEISQKARVLYEKRIMPYAKDLSSEKQKAILELQELVFTIDYYFEHNEKLDPAILKSFFSQAKAFLMNLDIDSLTQDLLLKDMVNYAAVEVSTRQGKKLTEYDIKDFYFLKSCDVRMQRHLIRLLNKKPPVSSPEEIDRDILEEIEDDIDDISEDRLTPLNGNRFLEALDLNDKAKVEEYIILINSLQNVPEEAVQIVLAKIKDKLPTK